jgi:hypothetical protein
MQKKQPRAQATKHNFEFVRCLETSAPVNDSHLQTSTLKPTLASLNVSMSSLRHLKLRAKARALEDDLFESPCCSEKAKTLLRLVKLLASVTEHDSSGCNKLARTFSADLIQLLDQHKTDQPFVWLLLLSYGSFVLLWSRSSGLHACFTMQAMEPSCHQNSLPVSLLPGTLQAQSELRIIRGGLSLAEAEAALCIVRACQSCLPQNLQVRNSALSSQPTRT